MNPTQATIVAILPLLVGGVFTAFKGLLEDKDAFKDRCARLTAISTDRIAKALDLAIKTQARRGPSPISLEDGTSSLSLDNDVASLIAKHGKLCYRLCVRRDILNICHVVHFFGIFASIIALLATYLLPGHEVLVSGVCLTIVAAEVASVRVQYVITRRSEDDEEIL